MKLKNKKKRKTIEKRKDGDRKQVEWRKNGKIKKIQLKLKTTVHIEAKNFGKEFTYAKGSEKKDKGKENKDKTDKKMMKILSKKKQNWPKIKDDENN